MKKLIFPLLLIFTIALTGCGSDSSAPKAADTKTSLPPAAPTEKIDDKKELEAARQRNKEFMNGTNDNADHSWRNSNTDLIDSGKPHHFSK